MNVDTRSSDLVLTTQCSHEELPSHILEKPGAVCGAADSSPNSATSRTMMPSVTSIDIVTQRNDSLTGLTSSTIISEESCLNAARSFPEAHISWNKSDEAESLNTSNHSRPKRAVKRPLRYGDITDEARNLCCLDGLKLSVKDVEGRTTKRQKQSHYHDIVENLLAAANSVQEDDFTVPAPVPVTDPILGSEQRMATRSTTKISGYATAEAKVPASQKEDSFENIPSCMIQRSNLARSCKSEATRDKPLVDIEIQCFQSFMLKAQSDRLGIHGFLKQEQTYLQHNSRRTGFTSAKNKLSKSSAGVQKSYGSFQATAQFVVDEVGQAKNFPAHTGSLAKRTTVKGDNKGKGNGGKKGKNKHDDRGRDGDSPDPVSKAIASPEDKILLQHIRARQNELKKLFATVGNQQREILDVLAIRNLEKLIRKPKSYKNHPEYVQVTTELGETKNEVIELSENRYKLEIALANQIYSSNVEVAKQQFHDRVAQAQREHEKGSGGDLIIFQRAHGAKLDDTGTENDSDEGRDFPQYHELPEPDTRIRGYSSSRIKDERPLKKKLPTYDEQAQRDVIDDDIIGPVVKAVAEENAGKLVEEKHKRTFDLEKLIEVAMDQLKSLPEGDSKDEKQLSDADMTSDDLTKPVSLETQGPPRAYEPQFSLSRLADTAEAVRNGRVTGFMFMPMPPSEDLQPPAQFLSSLPPHVQHQPEQIPLAEIRVAPMSNKKPAFRVKGQRAPSISKTNFVIEDPGSHSSSNASTPHGAVVSANNRMAPPPKPSVVHHPQLFHYPPEPQIPYLIQAESQNPKPVMNMPIMRPVNASRRPSLPPLAPLSLSEPVRSLASAPISRTSSFLNSVLSPSSPSVKRKNSGPSFTPEKPEFVFSPHRQTTAEPHQQTLAPQPVQGTQPSPANYHSHSIPASKQVKSEQQMAPRPSPAKAHIHEIPDNRGRVPISPLRQENRSSSGNRVRSRQNSQLITFTPTQTPESQRFKIPAPNITSTPISFQPQPLRNIASQPPNQPQSQVVHSINRRMSIPELASISTSKHNPASVPFVAPIPFVTQPSAVFLPPNQAQPYPQQQQQQQLSSARSAYPSGNMPVIFSPLNNDQPQSQTQFRPSAFETQVPASSSYARNPTGMPLPQNQANMNIQQIQQMGERDIRSETNRLRASEEMRRANGGGKGGNGKRILLPKQR